MADIEVPLGTMTVTPLSGQSTNAYLAAIGSFPAELAPIALVRGFKVITGQLLTFGQQLIFIFDVPKFEGGVFKIIDAGILIEANILLPFSGTLPLSNDSLLDHTDDVTRHIDAMAQTVALGDGLASPIRNKRLWRLTEHPKGNFRTMFSVNELKFWLADFSANALGVSVTVWCQGFVYPQKSVFNGASHAVQVGSAAWLG